MRVFIFGLGVPLGAPEPLRNIQPRLAYMTLCHTFEVRDSAATRVVVEWSARGRLPTYRSL